MAPTNGLRVQLYRRPFQIYVQPHHRRSFSDLHFRSSSPVVLDLHNNRRSEVAGALSSASTTSSLVRLDLPSRLSGSRPPISVMGILLSGFKYLYSLGDLFSQLFNHCIAMGAISSKSRVLCFEVSSFFGRLWGKTSDFA